MIPAEQSFIDALPTSLAQGYANLCVLAHAWHESAGFSRMIGTYNCWGIKVPQKQPWLGPVVTCWTSEFSKMAAPDETQDAALPRLQKVWGRTDIKITGTLKGMWKIGLPQTFVDFNSQADAMQWYCSFIKRLYPLAFNSRGNTHDYFLGLTGKNPAGEQVPGALVYATDPVYAQSLDQLAASLKSNPEVSPLI